MFITYYEGVRIYLYDFYRKQTTKITVDIVHSSVWQWDCGCSQSWWPASLLMAPTCRAARAGPGPGRRSSLSRPSWGIPSFDLPYDLMLLSTKAHIRLLEQESIVQPRPHQSWSRWRVWGRDSLSLRIIILSLKGSPLVFPRLSEVLGWFRWLWWMP